MFPISSAVRRRYSTSCFHRLVSREDYAILWNVTLYYIYLFVVLTPEVFQYLYFCCGAPATLPGRCRDYLSLCQKRDLVI